ncbi:MAG: hypothetical protein JNN08_19315 [Bryobacterales bacterium]|nr:hypothetical protein [Bryobacterales bacterium]
MAPADPRLVPQLETLLTRSLGADSWEVYEPPSQRASPGCLVTAAGLLLLAWLYTRGYEHALGWLWILLSAAAGYVIARHEYARTSLRLDRAVISIRSGFPWSPRLTELPLDQLSEIRVLILRHSRQSTTSYDSTRYYAYQLALATAAGREIPLFREIRDEQLAGQAAHRLAELLPTPSPIPVVSKPPPPPMRLRTGIALVAAAAVLFFLIARAC